jgi:ribonuclease P protein component
MDETPRKKLTLGKDKRIKYGRDFKRIRELGSRLSVGSLILNWLETPDAKTSRVGVVVSRKIGGAVKRNRVRRLLREVFRLHQHELCRPVDIVLIAKPSIAEKNFRQIESEYLNALASAGLFKPSANITTDHGRADLAHGQNQHAKDHISN